MYIFVQPRMKEPETIFRKIGDIFRKRKKENNTTKENIIERFPETHSHNIKKQKYWCTQTKH